jgi:hypothetical protein
MYDLGIIVLVGVAAFVMLLRGDPKWALPALIGAVALFLVPTVTMLTIAYFTPKGSPLPLLFEVRQGEFFPYFYPAGSLQEALERNYRAIHETFEALLTVQQASYTALFAVASAETVVNIIASLVPGGALVQLSKYAMYVSKVGDPVLQISLTTYNAVTAFVMVFHFLEFLAGAAVKMAVPLLALSLLAVIFGPTRALGGALLFFALIMIVPSYIGYYLAPLGEDFAVWGLETAKWLNATAANATGIAPMPLVTVEGTPHTLFFARYNNTFVKPNAAELGEKMREVLTALNSTMLNSTGVPLNSTHVEKAAAAALELADKYKVFEKTAFNGTDWVSTTAGSVTPIAYGNKTWLSTTAINTWLDFPAPRPEEGGCISHGDFREFIDYLMPPDQAQRLKERVANLSNAICQFHQWLGYRIYFLRIGVPAHWRFLTVAVNYTAKDRHGVVDRGVVYGWNGVWGWLAGPDNETCFNASGNKTTCAALDATLRVGRYNFSLWSGEKRVVDPVVDWVRSVFSFAVRNSSRPVFSRSINLHRWVETCEWCCEYVNGTCTQWCSSSRDVWQRADVAKRLGSGRYQYNTTVYSRPWVPEEEQNYTGGIPTTTRTWDVQIWLEYGPWSGDGTPPSDASCYTHDNRTYMVLSFFRAVSGPPRILYAFAWTGIVGVEYPQRGGSLPDILANYTDTDGVKVVEYLEGVEHQHYCQPALVPTAEPRWRPVVDAERNLTKLLRDNYLTLVVIRNVSLAYFARVGPYLAAAETSNSSLAKAAVASVREYLALVNKTPAAVPLYYTAPDSYSGRNVLVACVVYDWRAPVNLTAELRLNPGREWWVASYPMGHSRVAEAVATAKADMFRYVFGTPPPPPPANLSGFVKQWRIPWNNRTLPYTPYYDVQMKMPPRDNETGIPLWSIQHLEDVQMTQSNVLSWLLTVLFVTILSIVAVFEFLGALFDFPTPMRAVFGFVIGVIQDWTYWLPFRVAVRGKLLLRIWLAVKRPVMRRTVRTAARVHSFFATRIPGLRYLRSPDLKEYYRRYVLWRREIAIKDPAEQIREEIKVKWRREALERVLRAAEERADVEWLRNLERRREEERRARIEAARRIWNALRADNILEAARELSPRFDMWVQEREEMSRGSLSYHLFWWRLDRLPFMWRVLLKLDPRVVARLAAEGKVKPEDAALYLNLRAAVRGYMREMRRSWGWLHPLSLYVEQAREEFEKARQKMAHEAEKVLADFRRFITEFQRRYEALRRYFTEDLSKLDEKERGRLEETVKSVTECLNEAIRHFAVVDKAPRARLISALNEALQRVAEGKASQIPRDASVEGVVKHLALMDFDAAVRALRSAEKFLEAHYAVAPTRYDTRQIAAEVVKWKIEEQLPTLRLAGAARGIVMGGRSAEEGEALLNAWGPSRGRLNIEERPWEAVVHRFSPLGGRALDAREAVKIRPDVALTAEYAKYLAGFRAEEKALEALRKAVEYRRVEHMLERAEELRIMPKAAEELKARAEKLRQEVLQETSQIYRRFGEEFFFVRDLLEGRRVVRREVPEVREVVRAFEDALAEALKAPGRRERVFREVFMERVERLVEEYARRGDVEAVEKIRRAAAELAKISEAVGWRAVEDVALVLPAVAKAFEEAVKAVGGVGDAARLVDAFRARAEEAAKLFEQQGMSDAAERVRRVADKIAGEVYAGGWGAVERLRPLLSPEHAGGVLGRLELLHSLFTTEALSTYRELMHLRQVGELAGEVRGLASAPVEAAEVLKRAAEVVPAVKEDVEKMKTALKAGRWAEAAETVGHVEGVVKEGEYWTARAAGGVERMVILGHEAEAADRKISELMSRAGALEGEAARLLSAALEELRRGEYGVAAKQLEAVERALADASVLRLFREVRVEAEGLARAAERLAEVLERAPSLKPELEKTLEAVRRGEAERAREILTRIEAAGAAEVVKAVKEAKSLIPAAQPEERVYALALAVAGVSGLEAAAVKTALEAAAGRNYSRALALTEAVEKAANERLAAVRDVEPVAKTLERLGLETRRLSSPEYREQAVRELEKAAESLKALADLPVALQRVDAEKAAKAAEAFGLGEAASLFKAVERVRKEAGDVYPIFVKAVAEALRAPEGERTEMFRRVFTAEAEKMVKAFEERGLGVENLRRAAETALKAAESIAWKAPEEVAQRLSSAVEEAERLMARLRDEAVVRQISEYGYYSALASLAREAKEVVTAKRDVEAKLAKLIDDVKPAVELVAPHLSPLLEKVKAGDYSVLPAVEAELPKLAERHRQLQKLVGELGEAKKSLEKVAHIDKKVKELEKALKKAPDDVKAVFDEALKSLKVKDFERAVAEFDKILKIIEEKRARLEPLEERIREARALAEQLGLEKVVKALERPTERNVSKALGELERELARLYGALELVEYVRRPRADAEFGHAWAVVRMLGLEEADRLFKALSEASLYLLREGREVFRNPLYDEVKHLIDQEHVRALVRAPMYSYVVDRLGPDVLQPVYAKWYGFFTDYGPYLNAAFEHAKTSAVKAGAPLGLTGGFSYAGKMMKWLGDFSQEAVARGLKAYYRGEGRPFRELSEMTIRGAKIQLFDKAASVLMAKATQMLSEAKTASDEAAKRLVAEAHELKLLASVLRAKAAYEEVRMVNAYLKGAERRAAALLREAEKERDMDRRLALETKAREMLEAAQRKAEKHLADARARYKAYFAEVRDFVGGHGDVREVGMKYFGLTARAFAGDPEAVAEKMIRAVDIRRVISWVDELKLPKELGEIAVRIADAERVYNKFEKVLRAKAEPIPPVYDLEKAGRFFTDVRPHPPPQRSRLEVAVPKVVRDVFAAYYGKLKETAERAVVYLALVKNDERYAKKEVKKAYQALQKALKTKDKEQALKALEELKAALKALGIEAEGEDVKTVLKAVEEKLRPAYEEYVNARREYISAVKAVAKFSPEAALALGEAAKEGGLDSIGRWMSLVAYKTGNRALEEYARYWARPVEERWDALPQAVRELIAKKEEEAVYELVRNTLRNAGIGVKKGVEMNLEGFEKALERVFTANGEWPEMREYVKQVVEAARRVQRGEASTEELEKAVDGLLAAYGARAAERFVRSDRMEDVVAEMHEGMRHYARDTGLRVGREAAERALLLGLSTMPEEVVETYAKGGWRGRLEPYTAYWTEDEKLARRAGEAGWEVRQIKRPVSFEEGVPKEWRTGYVAAPFGFDLSAVERAVVEHVDGAREGVARVRPVEWPVPEAYLWFILKDRQPVKEGEWITAYSIDRLSIEEPLSKFGEALRARNYDEMKKTVRELYEARFNRTLWQMVYEFDRERAEAALEHLRQKYGEPESKVWERHDELYLTWLAFRLADEYADYLRSGAGREFKTKEEVAGAVFMPWLPVELAPLFWLRLVGDPEGGAEFRAAWYTAVDMWFERMAAPYTPKKPAVARKAVELFNAFVGARLRYEELFPPPPPPKPETQRQEAAKPETKPTVEVQRPEERGLRREVEKPEVRPQAVRPEIGKPEVVKPEAPKPEAKVVRGLRREERPRAPVVDVMRVESVDYLLERFGFALDKEAAFKAKSLVTAKVKARLEKVAAKEPEFAHILAEVAERVLSSFGRLTASPDAARHVYNALFYLFEGYQTRDGELLFKMIEHTVKEAVKKAEEAGIPDAEYRIKQFVLEVIDILARAGERYKRDALKGVSTVEKALRASALAGFSAAALYSVYSGLYSEAVVSSVASAVALAEVGQYREAVEYVQKAAKTLYEAAKEVFEKVKVTVQRLVELFVEAVTRVLAWVDEHKAYLFLMAAVAAGAVALSAVLNMWGMIELEKPAYAASLTPFVTAGVREYSREEVFNILKNDPDPYEKFKEVAKAATAGRVKLAEPWESLRVLIMPRPSEERKLMWGGGVTLYSKYLEDEKYKRALFYATLALEEVFGVYRSALRKYVETVQRVEVGEEPFKRVAADLGRLAQLAEEEGKAFENALKILRERLNEYAVKYGLRDLLDVNESMARRLAEAKQPELSRFSGVSFGTKAYAALIAYREYALGRRGVYGIAAWHWLEVGGPAWLLYYAPITAYEKAERAGVERPVTVEEMLAEAFRRLFLKPGADYHRRFVEELTKGGKLALMLENEAESSYVFRLFRLEEGDKLKELGIKLRIAKVREEGASIVYALEFDARWREFFKQELEAAMKAAEEVGGRLPVEDHLLYMVGWVNSDVAISGGLLQMGTSHRWQLAETKALFGWSYVTVFRMNLTLEGPKLQVVVEAPLDSLNEAIRRSAEGGWLKMLGIKAESWEGLKGLVVENWDGVVDAAARRLGEEVRGELEALRDKLNDDKVAREVVAPALLLIQAERLGVNETTLRYFGAVTSGAIGGDGYVSTAMGVVGLTSGMREVALLWAAALAAHGIEAEVRSAGRKFDVVASGGDAVKLAGLYFLFGPPLLEGDEKVINYKLAEAVRLGAEGLSVSWEGLRRTPSGRVAADLIISEGGVAVKYNVYLRGDAVELQFASTDRSRVELAARLLRLAGVSAEVTKVGNRNVWYVVTTTDRLAAGHERLRKALAEIVRRAVENGWVDEKKTERWLEKLEEGRVLMEGWPKYLVRLVRSGALDVRYRSTSRKNIEREAQRLENMGLEEGKHFTVKMPEEGRDGYVYIRREGLAHAAWLSVYGEGEQRELAARFVEHILKRAEEAGKEVHEKAKKIIEEGMSRDSLTLKGLKKEVEVDGRRHVVKVIDGEAVEEDRDGRKLLRIRITAEVDGVKSDYTITFGRRSRDNEAVGRAYAKGDAPEVREADAERFAAVVEALTGRKPRINRMKNGKIMIECYEGHLEGFRRYAELADDIERWLEETSRKHDTDRGLEEG